MCTAISYRSCHHYFGRNLDLEYHYNETVTITPRNFPFVFRMQNPIANHYAIIGMATVSKGYPLYYDATNEHGLSMAGLNFPGNAKYHSSRTDKTNITPYELIPWVLAQCKSIEEAKSLLSNVNLLNEPFSDDFPLSPLHWMIADKHGCLVAEPMADGLKIYSNPVCVLTNNPPFPYHLQNLCNFRGLSSENGANTFTSRLELQAYSNGMGAMGLPGDLSSASRFVRGTFVLHNSPSNLDETASITQFFHVLDSVSQKKGSNKVNGNDEITVYSSCCDTNCGIYYYSTYTNRQICAVDINKEDLNADVLVTYPLPVMQNVYFQN